MLGGLPLGKELCNKHIARGRQSRQRSPGRAYRTSVTALWASQPSLNPKTRRW